MVPGRWYRSIQEKKRAVMRFLTIARCMGFALAIEPGVNTEIRLFIEKEGRIMALALQVQV